MAEVMDSADVGVIQGRGRTGFTREAVKHFAAAGPFFWQELYGHAAAEVQVLRLIDEPHAAGSEARHNTVVRKCLTGNG